MVEKRVITPAAIQQLDREIVVRTPYVETASAIHPADRHLLIELGCWEDTMSER
ncbi:MAG: hypothetical protein M3Y22_17420 [Pseudomonadota bacterium]|nr:hypothetical protein [Pseudomonadota bacterium]